MTLTSWGEAFQAYQPRGLVSPRRLSAIVYYQLTLRNNKDSLAQFFLLQISSAVCFLLSPGASFIRSSTVEVLISSQAWIASGVILPELFGVICSCILPPLLRLTKHVSSGATLRVDAGGSLYSPQLWQVRSEFVLVLQQMKEGSNTECSHFVSWNISVNLSIDFPQIDDHDKLPAYSWDPYEGVPPSKL